MNLGHSASDHYASDISADGSILYFASEHVGGQGGSDIWQVKIVPNVNLTVEKNNEYISLFFYHSFFYE